MRIAVIADVHSNVHALDKVLAAIDQLRVDALVCLGDIIGYNAFPRECVHMIRTHADVVVAGNHDVETLSGTRAEGTNRDARTAGSWTRAQLDEQSVAYLQQLPNKHVDSDRYVAVHGCYLNPAHINGYVTSTMLMRNLRAVVDNQQWPVVAFCGHTHTPLVGVLRGDELTESELAEPIAWDAAADAVLLNPGSVGQPRDWDPRASFATVDFERRCAEVHRVPYDIEAAAAAIAQAGLPRDLGLRLREGR